MAQTLSEAQVREIVRAELRTGDMGVLIRQLQGGVLSGTGSPENVVAAIVGTFYRRLDGGVGTTGYAKTAGGSGNTGWTAFV